jgi:cell division protein FtsW
MKSEERNKSFHRVPPPVNRAPVGSGGRVAYSTPDYPLLVIAMFLTCIGVLMVFSASGMFSLKTHSTGTYFLWRELIWVVISLSLMFVTAFIDYRSYRKLAWPIFIGIVVLLMAVRIPHVGVELNGARRWIRVGGQLFHVGEFAKIGAIVIFAVMLDHFGDRIRDWRALAIAIGFVGFIDLLIIIQPDFGMVMVIAAISMAMLFVAGARIIYLVGLGALGVVGAVGLVLAEPYRMHRIAGFMNLRETATDAGYQTMQSLIAVASGRFFGRGLGESTQKILYLPEMHTDFIFSITAEELGILGLLLIVLLFVYLTIRGFHVASRCEDPLAIYLAFGIVFNISIQAFVNMGVALGLLPVTGLTLPFISFGGASLLCTYIGIGILLNVSMNTMARSPKRRERPDPSSGWNRRPSVPGNRPGRTHPAPASWRADMDSRKTRRTGGADRRGV